MKKAAWFVALVSLFWAPWVSRSTAQENKLENNRIGGGSVGAPQMPMWFAKEANFYAKYGLPRDG
jgi:hypothetical protein